MGKDFAPSFSSSLLPHSGASPTLLAPLPPILLTVTAPPMPLLASNRIALPPCCYRGARSAGGKVMPAGSVSHDLPAGVFGRSEARAITGGTSATSTTVVSPWQRTPQGKALLSHPLLYSHSPSHQLVGNSCNPLHCRSIPSHVRLREAKISEDAEIAALATRCMQGQPTSGPAACGRVRKEREFRAELPLSTAAVLPANHGPAVGFTLCLHTCTSTFKSKKASTIDKELVEAQLHFSSNYA
uniref:Uncharacterized protein n=1 Tax=Oryza nivara TaxID=4536 RepID=A0A0E0J141_ORYNI